MSDSRQAKTDRHREAMQRTAKKLHDVSKRAGVNSTFSDHLRRVQSADRKRSDKE